MVHFLPHNADVLPIVIQLHQTGHGMLKLYKKLEQQTKGLWIYAITTFTVWTYAITKIKLVNIPLQLLHTSSHAILSNTSLFTALILTYIHLYSITDM
jgi:hypothetical protein